MQFCASLIALVATLTAVSAQNSTCHDYVIISIRGTFELQGPSIGFPGMINATLRAIPNGIEYDAVYPASIDQTAYLGSDDVVRYITAGLESCPKQKYAILGYSQGASAAMMALGNYTEPGTAGYEAIHAVLVIGNPYHKPNQSVNVDQWDEDSTRKYAGAVYNATKPGSEGIPDVYYSNGKLLDICFQEDAICAPAYPNSSFNPGHLHYGEPEVQDLGASFLIPRLGGVYKNMTSPAVTTSTASGGLSPTGVFPSGTGVLPSGTGVSATGTGVVLPPGASSVPPSSTGVPPTYSSSPTSAASSSSAANGLFAMALGVMTVVVATAMM